MSDTAEIQGPAALSATPEAAPYPRYAVALLMAAYALNVVDRQIVTILAEPIKTDLHLQDWQLGLVTGFAFAIFYTVLGLPVARLADRFHRPAIIAASMAIWSGFTAFCGVTRTLPQLLLGRMGVGFGEAGCTPAAHSFITEYTPPSRRAGALAFYSLGGPLGSLAGLAMGGLVADRFGWRAAFIFAGAPGLLFALLVAVTLRDPRRALRPRAGRGESLPLSATLAELRGKPAFWWISLATATTAFTYSGQTSFYGPLFMRTHAAQLQTIAAGVGLGPAGFLGIALGLIIGISGGLGTVVGGALADRAARRGPSGYARVPAYALAVAAPLFAAVPLLGDARLCLGLLVPTVFVHALTYGSTYASIQTLARPASRAMATAIMLFITNVVGLGLGPTAVGALSDLLTAAFGPTLGLRWAMAGLAGVIVAGSGFYALALRTFSRDADGVEASP